MTNPRHRPDIAYQQIRREKKLRLWQLLLPVWTTSIFIAFENAIMSVISTDYTTFFFIVCIHRHGMMELQLMSRNEFLLCLIEKKTQNKKILVPGSTHPWSTMLSVWTVPSSWRLLGAENMWTTWAHKMPLELSYSQDRKAKPTLRNIQKIKRVYH